MSEVELLIAGKPYLVACGAGEEARLTQLGGMVDAKLQAMHDNLSAQDSQNLLFAALLLADELDEARNAAPKPSVANAEVAPQLELLADALENCAIKLESSLARP
jgi:cell division protein ZapA